MAFTFKHGDRPIKNYQIQRGIGRGGFGEVYYAVSDGGREVALKYLHSNQDIELRGISHCMNLKSPHLVDIFDVVKNDEGDYFVVMEYVSGPSLRDLLTAEPHGIGPAKAAFFLEGMAKGLSYLHERGIVHRDLKPGNIFYEDGFVKIGDYGLSKFISRSSPGGNTASIGTVAYMAPEVGSGCYAQSIDIYALGVMLYEMLVGKVPFEGQSQGEVLMKHLMDQPEVDQLPAPFPHLIRKALAKDPRDRYQRVTEMVDELLGSKSLRESMANFDADGLTQVARRAVEDLRVTPGMPVATAPEQRPFDGSSAGLELPEKPGLVRPDYAPAYSSGQRVQFAGFWIRLLALIIDGVVVSVPAAILKLLPVPVPVWLIYSVLLLTYWNGQTVGKRLVGIRVVDLYGRQLTFWRALGREASKILSTMTLMVGFVLAAFSQRKQSLHDMIASTYVIHTQEPVELPQAPDPLREARLARRQQNMQERLAPPRKQRIRIEQEGLKR